MVIGPLVPKAAGILLGTAIAAAAASPDFTVPSHVPDRSAACTNAFDFEFGAWSVKLSRLLEPLSGANDWVEYTGTSVVRRVWGGRANLGELEVEGEAGRIQGMSLRLNDPRSCEWRIHWANSRTGIIGPAMVGGFQDGIGEFYNQEEFNGRAIFVRFIFSDITPTTFSLEQAFSADGGKSWEANWIAHFERADVPSAADTTAIRALWTTLDEHWNGRDADRFSNLFAESATFDFVDRGERIDGRAMVRTTFTERFASFAPELRHRTTVHAIRPIAADAKAVEGTVEILRVAAADGGEPALLRTFSIFAVMQRNGDVWEIGMLRAYEVPPPA